MNAVLFIVIYNKLFYPKIVNIAQVKLSIIWIIMGDEIRLVYRYNSEQTIPKTE